MSRVLDVVWRVSWRHFCRGPWLNEADSRCMYIRAPFPPRAHLCLTDGCLLIQIVEGNWVVKRAAGSTPAILGTKLKQHHFRGDNYLETDLEIGAYDRPRGGDPLLARVVQHALFFFWVVVGVFSIRLARHMYTSRFGTQRYAYIHTCDVTRNAESNGGYHLLGGCIPCLYTYLYFVLVCRSGRVGQVSPHSLTTRFPICSEHTVIAFLWTAQLHQVWLPTSRVCARDTRKLWWWTWSGLFRRGKPKAARGHLLIPKRASRMT